MPFNLETAGAVRVITLEGKLATEVAQDLKPKFDAYVVETPGPTLLDMSAVLYISSYLVGVLVDLRSRLSAKGFEVHLAGLDPRHRLVLQVSGLADLFRYHATRADGIAALAGSSPFKPS